MHKLLLDGIIIGLLICGAVGGLYFYYARAPSEHPSVSEYVVKEYAPATYFGNSSQLVYGEINYTLRYDYAVSNYTPPFRVRLWGNSEGLTYNTETVRTIDNYEYAEWNFGTGEAYLSKSGVQRAALYEDSNGSFVGENFGWLGSRWCQGRLLIDTENEAIKNTATDIRGESISPYVVAKKVALWMVERLSFEPGTEGSPKPPKTPVEVLDSGESDCIGLSMLYASLCRAAGVPTRLVYGDIEDETLVTGHFWAEFYDGVKWIPVDVTFLIRDHAGSAQLVFGPASDWFGYVDARDIPRCVEDASENSIERVYSDTFHFECGLTPQLGATQTRSGSISIQKSAKLRIYNTGRRELVF